MRELSHAQMQFNFDTYAIVEKAPEVLIIQTYQCTTADRKFRRRIRKERGETCEKCNIAGGMNVHHILETRIYAKHALEPFNVLVLCGACHASIGYCENHAPALRCAFYAELSAFVRARHLPFIKSADASKNLIAAFEWGNAGYWHMQSIRGSHNGNLPE